MPKKARNKVIKTAIIVDFMGGGGRTAEEEIEAHKERFGELVKPARLAPYQACHASDGEYGIRENTELVIYDYGGLMPGTSLMEDNARAIVNWAESHPNCLVVIVSTFTYQNLIEIEMQHRGLTLPNIVQDDPWQEESPIPKWFMAGIK